jgi:hypothetical protein
MFKGSNKIKSVCFYDYYDFFMKRQVKIINKNEKKLFPWDFGFEK